MAAGTKDEEKPGSNSQRLERALTHPVRTRMHQELSKRPLGLSELADMFGEPEPWIRYHYRILERLGGIPTMEAEGGS